MSDSTTPTPAPQASGPQPAKIGKGAGCLGVIILCLLIGWITDIAGCDSGTPTTSGPKALSKAEWRAKVRPYYNPGGGVSVTTIANFKALVGEPSQTQTVEGHAYWYYQCSDGTIQIDLIDPNLSGGRMLINNINDY